MARVSIETPAPDFCLEDFTGKNVKLSDFQTNWNVLLVFNRGFV